jgi:glycosyltransferase involved in cell wall biosynthesis
MTAMHATYITTASIPSDTAHGAYAANLCAALSRNGCDTVLLASRGVGEIDPFLGQYPGLKAERYGLSGWRRLARVKSAYISANLLRASGGWFAHRQFITNNEIVAAILALRRKPFVFDMHGFGPNSRLIKFALQSRACLGCIFNCNAMQRQFESAIMPVAKPKLILGSGVRLDHLAAHDTPQNLRRQAGISPDRTVICYIGSMGGDRGIDLMLNEAARWQSSKKLYWLFVGGWPKQTSHWQRMAEELGLSEDDFRFAGFQPQDHLGDWYAVADLLCAPYTRKVRTLSYMSPMKLVEYQAIGKPILAADFPTVREAVQSEGVEYFDPDRPNSLGEALTQVLGRPDACQDLTANAKAMAGSVTWDAKARRLIGWLRSIDPALAND